MQSAFYSLILPYCLWPSKPQLSQIAVGVAAMELATKRLTNRGVVSIAYGNTVKLHFATEVVLGDGIASRATWVAKCQLLK